MDKISIIVPCWNEEAALPIYYKEMSRIIGQMDTDIGGNEEASRDRCPVQIPVIFQKFRKRGSNLCGTYTCRRRLYCGDGCRSSGSAVTFAGDVPDIKRRRLRQRGNETFHQSRRAGDTVVPVQTVLSFYQQNI